MINEKSKIKYFEYPYKIWVVDDFLDIDVLNTIKENWPDENDDKWHGGHEYIGDEKNILEQGMISFDIKDTHGYLKTFLEQIHSKNLNLKISEITNINNLIPDSSNRWSGIRVMKSGSFQAIHSDARINPETGLRKELTCLLYFNENWKSDDFGMLEIWDDDVLNCVHEIEPIDNRLVIFQNSDTSYHGVPIVNNNRKSITWSILKEGKSTNRRKALFVARPTDDEKINELGKIRVNVKDAHK